MTRHHHPDPDDGYYLQRVVITLDIPGGPGTDTIAAGALLDVLDHFRNDAIQAHWVTLEISEPTP